ncbi:hypothetical protein CCR94_23840 [Rhodoblastus sphagnicola]|uniref:Uncharacterized protein n=1 Tax=Rhodoblastus sphagnicola TaxID=333368 RepID=A0A2S6MU28_9HYPH|nr:CHRD domain-containing protein [Rhodoblastus sphagnicola]MBB4199744.1 hypothetical protein [Rhodoblastus sphagnicola]PPQ25862.1 hypothetical protein CCR94_23840 [Rhodoblastus sphagnicola]
MTPLNLLRNSVIASILPVLLATYALSESRITATLSGANEVPAVQTPGKGTIVLALNPATRELSWTLEFSDLTGPATMVHFHGPAIPGNNAPPVLWVVEKGAVPISPVQGSAILTPEQAKNLADGEWYVNVHTQTNPSGEIRGLIAPLK